MFVNDLPDNIQSGCLLYADDVKIYRKITSPSDGQLLQNDLNQLRAWSVRWGLKLNPSKCKSFTMTLRRAPVQTKYFIGSTELEHVKEIRDLGVILDSKLTFSSHVDNIVKRANRGLGLLIRSFQSGSNGSKFKRSALMAAYYANVRSILEYCSVIWAGAADSHMVRVDRVQHKFLMWLIHHSCSGQTDSLSYQNLLHHFQIPSLAARRVQHDLLFIRNIFHAKLDVPNLIADFNLHVPIRSTRTQSLFHVPRARVNTVQHGMFCRLPRLTNQFVCDRTVEVDFFADDFNSYKAQVIRYVARSGMILE